MTDICMAADSQPEKSNSLIVDGEPVKYTDAACAQILKLQLKKFKNQPLRDDLSLFSNIETIGRVIGLSDAEKAIMFFAAALEIFASFKEAVSAMRQKNSLKGLGNIIAFLSGQPEAEVSAGLREDST